MTSHRIMLAGNPNVGKSTIFNSLTGLKQHTGNWAGKTVALTSGKFRYKNQVFEIQDLPGTYSMISNSPEEEIARDAISQNKNAYILVVTDATCLARNLNLVLQIMEISPHVALCVNLLDEAKRKGIEVNLDKMKEILGIPVIGISAQNRHDIQKLKEFLSHLQQVKPSFQPVLPYPDIIEGAITDIIATLDFPFDMGISKRFLALKLLEEDNVANHILETISIPENKKYFILKSAEKQRILLKQQNIPGIVLRDTIVSTLVNQANQIAADCVTATKGIAAKAHPLDRFLTSKIWGIPFIFLFLIGILWLTISGANLPSKLLMTFFFWLKPFFRDFLTFLPLPTFCINLLCDGIYQTVAWVTAVMLPPLVIFFPLFTLLEDFGYLPRLAFNLDRCLKRCGSCGKQALTMCKEKFKMFLQHNL